MKRRGKRANVLFGGREEKLAAECVYLVQRTMHGAGSMASAAVVGATVVGAAAVGSVVFGAAEVCVTSGVPWCAAWCSISAAVVAVMSGSSAAVVGTTVCVRSNSWSSNSGRYLCVEWCVELCVAQCRCVELSCRATHNQMHAE